MIDREDPQNRYLSRNGGSLRGGQRVVHALNEVEVRHVLRAGAGRKPRKTEGVSIAVKTTS